MFILLYRVSSTYANILKYHIQGGVLRLLQFIVHLRHNTFAPMLCLRQ